MNEIQDIKEVFDVRHWENRIQDDPKRLYAFLLCYDEHKTFASFIQEAWRTLDALSGAACDVFTLEPFVMPHDRFISNSCLPISGSRLGTGRIAKRHERGGQEKQIAIDNGLMIPDRTQCLSVRDKLFTNPNDIILPGLAIFPSIYAKKARFYNCSGLSAEQLSDSFQKIFGALGKAYAHSNDAAQNFTFFQRNERFKLLRQRIIKAILNSSLKDVFGVLTGGLRLIKPKNSRDGKDAD